MKRVAFIALGLLLFAGGVLAGRFSVREPVRDDRTEFERLEDRCLRDWAKVLRKARARSVRRLARFAVADGVRQDYVVASCI
jgi:hypothetical protein